MMGLRLLAVMVLVAINGFFAAAEFSLVAVRVSRIRQLVEQGDARARMVQLLLGQLDRVVSGVQVGITLTSLGLGAIGESTFAELFLPLFAWMPGARGVILAHTLAVVLAFFLLTALHVVLGELVPKTVSLERAASVSLLVARPFYWYLNTFRPAISLLDGASARVVRLLGVAPRPVGHTMAHSVEELEVQIRQAAERGVIAPAEERFILGAIELSRLRVREIMVPRPDVHALVVESSLDDVLTLFATTQRSRLPVYEGNLDHVLGLVHIKDVLWLLLDRDRRAEEGVPVEPFDLRRLLRQVAIVPESKLAAHLLVELRTRRIGLAMVVDEFGSILGLVTLEDLLEELVGEIHDEFDVVEAPLVVGTGAETAMVFDGAIGLRDLETQYDIRLPEDPAYSTLGGFVLAQLGFVPRGGEGFEYAGYRFTVLEMERRRVARVKLQRIGPPVAAPAAPGPEQPAPSGSRPE